MFSDFFSPLKREINFSLFLLKSTKATELQKMQKKKIKNHGYILNELPLIQTIICVDILFLF